MEEPKVIILPERPLPKITCICGAIINMCSVQAHFKSKKHKIRTGEVKPYEIKQGKFLVKF